MLDNINKKLIDPFLKSSGLSESEQNSIRNVIWRVVDQSIMIEILKILTESDRNNFVSKLESSKTYNEKAQVIHQILEANLQAQQAVKKYIEGELPAFIEEVISAYLNKATSEQASNFLKYAESSSS